MLHSHGLGISDTLLIFMSWILKDVLFDSLTMIFTVDSPMILYLMWDGVD